MTNVRKGLIARKEQRAAYLFLSPWLIGLAVFWVAPGAQAPPQGIARAAAALRFLVTPSPLPGQRPEFTVAGCGVHRLGRRSPNRQVAA